MLLGHHVKFNKVRRTLWTQNGKNLQNSPKLLSKLLVSSLLELHVQRILKCKRQTCRERLYWINISLQKSYSVDCKLLIEYLLFIMHVLKTRRNYIELRYVWKYIQKISFNFVAVLFLKVMIFGLKLIEPWKITFNKSAKYISRNMNLKTMFHRIWEI